jgi:hypothetical protein
MHNQFEDISLMIYQKVVNGSNETEVERTQTIEHEITTLSHMIKTKEVEIT